MFVWNLPIVFDVKSLRQQQTDFGKKKQIKKKQNQNRSTAPPAQVSQKYTEQCKEPE